MVWSSSPRGLSTAPWDRRRLAGQIPLNHVDWQ